MKKKIRIRLIFILTFAMFFTACGNYGHKSDIKVFPPESVKVLENGSVPPGFNNAIRDSGVNRECITCNSQNRYGKYLKNYSEKSASILMETIFPFLRTLKAEERRALAEKLEDHIMWAMVRAVLIEGDNNNFGAIILKGRYWKDNKGKKHPVTIFRTAFTPEPERQNSCYYTLLKCGNVKHVINLYDGEMDVQDLVKAEKNVAAKFGASYVMPSKEGYGNWRSAVRRNPKPGKERSRAKRDVIRLIKEQILVPGGKKPKGNILIHCGGGMHRTGMIVGILQYVFNGSSRESVKNEYSYHTGYRGKDRPGGFEQGNLDFIFEFKKEDFK